MQLFSRPQFRISLLSLVVITTTACQTQRSDVQAPTRMEQSPVAAELVKRINTRFALLVHPHLTRRIGATSTPILGKPIIDTADIVGNAVVPHFPIGKKLVSLTYPVSATAPIAVMDSTKGAGLNVTLNGAIDAQAELAQGYLVYRSAVAGADVVHRPSLEGTEELVVFERASAQPSISYSVNLPASISGLRLAHNVLEFLDKDGTPLFHIAPPFLIDTNSHVTPATLSVAGCAVDTSDQPAWRRAIVQPGAKSCTVAITWDDTEIHYPAALDSSWSTGKTMSLPRAEFATAVIASSAPKIVAAGGLDRTFNATATVDFFDPATGTWSLGPSLATARIGSTAVYNPTTSEVLVSGGYTTASAALATTELLAQSAASSSWSWAPSASMRVARYAHAATLLANGRALLAGGVLTDGSNGVDCDLYDFATHQLATQSPPNMQTGRSNFFAAAVNNGQSVLVTGGFTGPANANPANTATAELYNAATNQWVSAPDMPSQHTNHSGVTLPDGSVMVLGGTDDAGFNNEADIYTFSSTPPYGAWSNAGTFSAQGRIASAALTSKGTVVVGSGFAGPTHNAAAAGIESTEADLYDPAAGTWQKTVSLSVGHDSGAAQCVTYQGTSTTVFFGGMTQTGIHNGSEVFALSAIDTPCTGNAECVTGICDASVCVPPGFPITLDATALSNKGLVIAGSGTTPIDTTQLRRVYLPAGIYTLEVYSGVASSATFTVTNNGTVTYDPSLEGVLMGAGSQTLKVNGRRISIDATRLSHSSLQLLAYHFTQGTEVAGLSFNTHAKQTFTLLPVPTSGYSFNVDDELPADLSFSLDVAGNIHIPSVQGYVAAGEGDKTLIIRGTRLSLTIPNGLSNATLGKGIALPEGKTVDAYVLPYSGGTPFNLQIGNATTTLGVTASGHVTAAPEIVHLLQAQAAAGPVCSAENIHAEQNAWIATPLNCSGPANADASSTIYAPVPKIDPAARLSGPGRAPNMLPRFRKPAGGDPVLGDGEFTIQRTDIALAGYGPSYHFSRSYRSGSEMDGPLGVGWDHNYNQRILGRVLYDPQAPGFDPTKVGDVIDTNCDGTVQWQDGQGSLQVFTAANGLNNGQDVYINFTSPNPDIKLVHYLPLGDVTKSYWKMTYADGTTASFNRAGFLSGISDPAGNWLAVEWARAQAAPAPASDCVSTGFASGKCAQWLYGLISPPIGQRQRVDNVTWGTGQYVFYVYPNSDSTTIKATDRLKCISLEADCNANVLLNFTYDGNSRLSSVVRGNVGQPPLEAYQYHATATDKHACLASADLPNYCTRLCNSSNSADKTTCNNLDYQTQVQDKCRGTICANLDPSEDFCPANTFTIFDKRQRMCCRIATNGDAQPAICTNLLWGGTDCLDGCEQSNQCQDTRSDGNVYAIYAGGASSELDNDIIEVDDSQGHVVVKNQYGEDRADVSFDKVINQQLTSTSTDNTITFEYHDLLVEGGVNPTPIYTNSSGPPHWLAPYSVESALVDKFQLPRATTVNICPHVCANGATTCSVYDYQPSSVVTNEFGPPFAAAAVVIHDLHGRSRVQYLDSSANVIREANADTNEVTDYNYEPGTGLLKGVQYPSGVRTCIERDSNGRVVQSSTVPAAGFAGTTVTQATTMAYNAIGQLTDEVHDALGTPVKTHYERDSQTHLLSWVDQDVTAGAAPLRTQYAYNGEKPPAGILETPTQITYPNGRVDKFSRFDASMGGPQTIVLDTTSTAPDTRQITYDKFGRVTQTNEVTGYQRRFQYNDPTDIFRLSSSGHRPSQRDAWIDVPVQSHLVDGQTVIDSIAEKTRTTTFTNVGALARQKTLTATSAPMGTTLPDPQTTCYDYSPDGRLEAMILPEGNSVAYQYNYFVGGSSVVTTRGFGATDTSGAWAAGCRGKTAPVEDPGRSMPSFRWYKAGGFIDREVEVIGAAVTQYDTDGFGRVIKIQSVPNAVLRRSDPIADQQIGYDSAGHQIWVATRKPGTPYGRPTLPDSTVLSYAEFDYDLAGRVTTQRTYVVETGEVLVKSISYNDIKNTVTTTDRGVTTTTVLDGRGRRVSTTLPDGSVNSVVRRLGTDVTTTQSNSHGNIARAFNYDTRGLLLNIQDAKGALLYQGTYDDDGNQLTETRIGQGPVKWTYDAFGRLVQEDKTIATSPTPVTATTTYGYDLNDRLTSYMDAKNQAGDGPPQHLPWRMWYSGVDAPIKVQDPVGRVGTYSYARSSAFRPGKPATVLEPNGRVTSYAYDSLGRTIETFNGDCGLQRMAWECGNSVLSPQRQTTYDVRGNVQEVDAPNQASVHFTYDSLGRVIDDIVDSQTTIGEASRVHHAYLDAGRTETTDVSYGTTMFPTMTHRIDGMGRLHTVELAGHATALATYDFGVGAGGPLSLSYSNGANAAYSYDEKLRQTGIDVTFTAAGARTPTFVTSLQEALGVDSIPRMREHRFGTGGPMTDTFQVDLDGRVTGENLLIPGLTAATGEVDNNSVSAFMHVGNNWSDYTIDRIGNIKARNTRNSALVHVADNYGRLSQIGNDLFAHDQTDNVNGSIYGGLEFTFDQFTGEMLTAANGAQKSMFGYDALQRRRVEHRPDGTDRLFVWDGQKLVAHGPANSLSLDVPGDDIDSHIVTIDQAGSGAEWFYHQGPDQSVLAVSGSAGLVEGYTYSAFGETTIWNKNGVAVGQSAFGNIFQFQGQIYEALTKTYSMRARQYQPAWGQFLSPDPISTAGGPSLYAFTGGRPLTHRDSSGKLSCQISSGGCYIPISDSSYGAVMSAAGYNTTSWEDSLTAYAVANGGYTYLDSATGEYHLVVSGGSQGQTVTWPDNSVGNFTSDGKEIVFKDTVVNSWGIYNPLPGVPPAAAPPPAPPRSVAEVGRAYRAEIDKYRGPNAPLKLLAGGLHSLIAGHENDIDALLASLPLIGPFGAGVVAGVEEVDAALAGADALGDLSAAEIVQIQAVVDEAGRPLEVVGSAARAARTAASDIDYVVPPGSLPYYDGLEGALPGIDPTHGIVPGTANPYMGPAIRFEPGATPIFIPKVTP